MKTINETIKIINDGKEIDLTTAEGIDEAISVVDNFANNPLFKLFGGFMYGFNNFCNGTESIKNKLENMKKQLPCLETEDTEAPAPATLDDIAKNVAEEYLEDTVENWSDIDDERKQRSVKVIADFFVWLKNHADEFACEDDDEDNK